MTANIFDLLFLIFLFVLCSSCDSLQRTDPSDRKVVLEIFTEQNESTFPPGRHLVMRIFDDRSIEFDNYPPRSDSRPANLFENRSNFLTEDDFKRITSLLNDPTLLKAKDFYEPRRISPMSVDSMTKITITIAYEENQKEIVLKEFDNDLYLEGVPSYITASPSEYPDSLVELLKTVRELNLTFRKGINPESR